MTGPFAASAPHLSIVLNLHDEGELLAPTLRSLAEAVRFAQAQGLVLELLAVLDRADEATRAVCRRELPGFPCPAREIPIDFGSLGLARNHGIAAARGDFVVLADGDDLVSFDFLAALHAAACAAQPQCPVVMPGALVVFGDAASFHWVPGLADIGPLNLLGSNPFVSRFCQRRDAALALPFTDASAGSGYAFEDWRRHCDAVAAGCDIRTVPQAALFYRMRAAGLNMQGRSRGAAAISASPLFDPPVYLERCAADYRRLRSGAADDVLPPDPLGGFLGSGALAAARAIEPAIPPATAGPVHTPISAAHKQTGAAYYDICAALGGRSFDVLSIHEGAAPVPRHAELMVCAEIAREISARVETREAGARVVLRGPLEALLMLALKAAQSLAPRAPIHLRRSRFARAFFARFGDALGRERTLRWHGWGWPA